MINPGVVQNQPLFTPGTGASNTGTGYTPSGVPINPSGLPSPYPLSMPFTPSDTASTTASTSTPIAANSAAAANDDSAGSALGSLKPTFRVETDRNERFVMGQGSLQVDTGRDVCIGASGCGGGLNSGTPEGPPAADELEIKGIGKQAHWPLVPLQHGLARLSGWLLSSR